MKKILLIAAITVSLLTSCNRSGETFLPKISGSPYEILCVSSDRLWESSVGDTIRNYFGQEMLVLPQAEKEFKVLRIPNNKFERHFAKHRNVIQLLVNSNIDSAGIYYKESFRSKGQQYFILQAQDTASMIRLFSQHKKNIRDLFLKTEQERYISSFKQFPAKEVVSFFKDSMDMEINVPNGFRLNKTKKDFTWFSYETNEYSQGVIFFRESLTDATQFNLQILLDRVNDVIKENIPGPVDSTWMTLDMEAPYVTELLMAHDKYYTMQVRGLWDVENDFMAGPYVLNAILDKKNSRIIYALGYVYYPIKEKRKMVRRVEAVINSLKPVVAE